MKTKIEELRDLLFDQLKSINDPTKNIDEEIARSEAVLNVATKIIETGNLEIQYLQAMDCKKMPSTFFPSEEMKALPEKKN